MTPQAPPTELASLPRVSRESPPRRSRGFSLPAFWLCLLASLSFVFHFFSAVLSPGLYVMSVGAVMAAYLVTKPLAVPRLPVLPLCVLVLGFTAYSFWHSTRLVGAFADVLVLALSLCLVLDPVSRPGDYRPALACIVLWGVFFSAGTLLAFGARPLYNAALSVFPSHFASIVRRASIVQRIGGFSTNPGFTAGYVSCALLALTSTVRNRNSFPLFKAGLFVFLLAGLLFTGKRGHVLFLALAWGLCYLLPLRGNRKIARFFNLFLLVFVGAVSYVAFADFLADIPVVGRFAQTVSGFMEGEDVSSGRSRLWSWAIELARREPWRGIGWGDYRTTLGAAAGIVSELDVHNVYLQLLCETGIPGLAAFALFFLWFWTTAKKYYSICLASADPVFSSLRPVLHFSFLYQTFFLLYGITGNVLYDQHYQIVYMMACAMAVAGREACIRRAARIRRLGGLP